MRRWLRWAIPLACVLLAAGVALYHAVAVFPELEAETSLFNQFRTEERHLQQRRAQLESLPVGDLDTKAEAVLEALSLPGDLTAHLNRDLIPEGWQVDWTTPRRLDDNPVVGRYAVTGRLIPEAGADSRTRFIQVAGFSQRLAESALPGEITALRVQANDNRIESVELELAILAHPSE